MTSVGTKKFRVLSIDGGGFLGLASAAFIRGIEEHERVRFADRFDLFCGTSTGAIIALALANGRSGDDLVSLYQTLGPRVFPWGWWKSKVRFLRSILWAKYGSGALRSVLEQEFGDSTLGDLRAIGRHVLVPAFCLTTGTPRIFKTDHSDKLSLHDDYSLVDVALASTAAPTYLPVIKLKHPTNGAVEYFCDGGVAANHPALLGFAEATYEFARTPSDVQVLSISTPRQDLSSPSVPVRSRGILAWAKPLTAVFTDSNSYLAHTLLERLVASYANPRPLYARIDLRNTHRLPMDCTSISAAEVLIQHGAATASCNKTRDTVRAFLQGE